MHGRPYYNPKATYVPTHVLALLGKRGQHLLGPPEDAIYAGNASLNRCINCSQFARRKSAANPSAVHGRCSIDSATRNVTYWVEGRMSCPWWTRATAAQEAHTLYFDDPKEDDSVLDLSIYLVVNMPPKPEGAGAAAAAKIKTLGMLDGGVLHQTTDGGLFVEISAAYLHQLDLDGEEIPYKHPSEKGATHTKFTWAGVDFGIDVKDAKAFLKDLKHADAYSAGPKTFKDLADAKKKWAPPAGKAYLQTYTYENGEVKLGKQEIVDVQAGDAKTAYEVHFDMASPSPSDTLKMITEKMADDLAAEIDSKLWDELKKYEDAPVSFSIGGKAAGGKIPPLYGGDPVWPKELADLKYGTKMPAIENAHNIQVTAPNADEITKILEAINKYMDKHDALYKALGMKGTPKYPY